MKAPAATILACIATMAGAQTREPAGTIGQIGMPVATGEDAVSNQITTPSPNVRTPAPTTPRSAAAAAQLGDTRDAQAPVQLVREPPTGQAPAQLSHGPPSARPPVPLSRPVDGRTGAVATVEGQDGCDPAQSKRKARCRTVIETRSAEFPPPQPTPLSPEQRLLVEQRAVSVQGPQGTAIAQTAARSTPRAAGVDADAPTMQGLASVYIGQNTTPPVKAADPTVGLSADQAAAATAVLGALEAPRP
jgi:hypothetical protein